MRRLASNGKRSVAPEGARDDCKKSRAAWGGHRRNLTRKKPAAAMTDRRAEDVGDMILEDVPNAVNRFPLCRLYEARLVDGFPTGCPMAQPNPLAALFALQERGWQRIGAEQAGGTTDLDRVDICNKCLNSVLPTPSVRRLRALAGLSKGERYVA